MQSWNYDCIVHIILTINNSHTREFHMCFFFPCLPCLLLSFRFPLKHFESIEFKFQPNHSSLIAQSSSSVPWILSCKSEHPKEASRLTSGETDAWAWTNQIRVRIKCFKQSAAFIRVSRLPVEGCHRPWMVGAGAEAEAEEAAGPNSVMMTKAEAEAEVPWRIPLPCLPAMRWGCHGQKCQTHEMGRRKEKGNL